MNTSHNIVMNKQIARRLSQVTSEFYVHQAQSFSATRQMPWQGWKQCLDAVPHLKDVEKLRVLDIGCGNLRFARFLIEQVGLKLESYVAVDNCEPLVNCGNISMPVTLIKTDIVNNLLDNRLSEQLRIPASDLVVVFGFLHHVPGVQNRVEFLKTLLDETKPGGYLCVSFWQFMNNKKLAAKAHKTTSQALQELKMDSDALEKNDYLLGWQNQMHTWRYCHHFTQQELDELVVQLGSNVRVCKQFSADGKEDNLNQYLIFQRYL